MPIVSTDEFLSTKFDYLIIGGGTAGLVVAARLTEDPNVVVGVLEAGGDHTAEMSVFIPGMIGRNMFNPKFDWGFATTPEKELYGRVATQSRGKGLGGSSALNMTAFVRPSKEDIDAYELLGSPGWNWASVHKYMKKSETLTTPDLSPEEAKAWAVTPDPTQHGTDGPIVKSFPITSPSGLHTTILDSLENIGVARNPEPGAGRTVGSLMLPTSVNPKTATRSYSGSCYYSPNASRKNFIVLTEAHVTKINLEKTVDGVNRATGVNFLKDGKTATIGAGKEVILAAGTLQTPQLLELSGIGDRDVLAKVGIDCIIDLPGVGENLQDHTHVPAIAEVDKANTVEVLYSEDSLKEHQVLYAQQKGMLASMPSSCFAFMSGTQLGTKDDIKKWESLLTIAATPEVFANTHPAVRRGIEKQYKLIREWVDDPTQPMGLFLNFNGHYPVPGLDVDPAKRYVTFLCAYCHPFSRGTVHVNSTDPLAPPVIQQNYLSNPADLEVLVKTVALMLKLFNTKPIADRVVRVVAPPPRSDGKPADDESLKEYVRNALSTVHHPVGSASMLPREDGGVVNNRLVVYGTSNLRVIDCSIIPIQASSNIQTVAYAIGEMGADIIKGVV